MISAWVRSTACLASLKGASGLLRTTLSPISTCTVSTGAGAEPVFDFVAAECAVLEGREVGRLSGKGNVRRKLALEHLPGEQQLAAFVLVAGGVADERAIQSGRQLGSEVAHLVGMRHQHQLGLLLVDELFESRDESVRRVRLQQRRLDVVHLGDFLSRNLRGDFGDAAADDGGFQRPSGIGGDGLRAGERFQGNAIQLPSRCSATTRIVSAI